MERHRGEYAARRVNIPEADKATVFGTLMRKKKKNDEKSVGQWKSMAIPRLRNEDGGGKG